MTEQELTPNEQPGQQPPAQDITGGMAGQTPPSSDTGGAQAWTTSSERRMASGVTTDPTANEDDRLLAGLAYLSQVIFPIVVPAIMLLSETNKARPFQRFHAIQSLGTFVLYVIYEILALIVFLIFSVLTLGCLALVLWILFFLPVIPAIYYAYMAYQGKRFDVPLVTNFMRQQGWV